MFSSVSSRKAAKINPIGMDVMKVFHYLNFDGASKGNPGLGAAGAVIYDADFSEIWGGSLLVGEKITNNHAEYAGLLLGLEKAIDLNIKMLVVRGDSLLVINHMTGKYKCNSPNLQNFYLRAKELERNFDEITYVHVLRDLNKRADQLSNMPIKELLS